jgi:hypothetical protein
MNEPAGETLPGAGPVFVPRRVTGPVLAGVVPGQPQAVVHRAAELAYTLKVKLICAYVDITSYLADEPGGGPVDDVEATSAGILERLENTLDSCSSVPSPWSSHTASTGQFWSSRSPDRPPRVASRFENSCRRRHGGEGTATTGRLGLKRRIAAGRVQGPWNRDS